MESKEEWNTLYKKIGKLTMERQLLRDENDKLTKENNQYLELIHNQKEKITEIHTENLQLHGKIHSLQMEIGRLGMKISELKENLDNCPNCDDCDLAGAYDTAQSRGEPYE